MDEYRKYEPIFGSWYLSRLLGKGSFGKVFEITREEFGETYKAALKVISVPQDDEDVKARLSGGTDTETISEYYKELLKEIANENRIMTQLKGNSNIVSYEDHQIIPHDDGIGYDILIRMELLTPLVDRMIERNLSKEETIKLGIDICRALELCHRKNIIHRDIKPQNILISDNGDFKLGDFGISRTMEKTTGGMSKKGTYKYMAPEVFRGEDYDSTADIYSLGIVLYMLLNGNRTPFLPQAPERITPNDEEEAKMRRFRGEPLPPPSEADSILSQIILKACMADPKSRYRTATQMRKDLESYLQHYEEKTESTVGLPDAPVDTEAISSIQTAKTMGGEVTAAAVPRTARQGSAVPKAAALKNAVLGSAAKDRKKTIALAAGTVAAAVMAVFLICIAILYIAPASSLALWIDSLINGEEPPIKEENPEYQVYIDLLEDREDGIKAYTWQKDMYGRTMDPAKGIAIEDICGESDPELLFFEVTGEGNAKLEFCTCEYDEVVWGKYDEAPDYSGSGGTLWTDGVFTDNTGTDTKYMIYTGETRGTLYIVSSMGDETRYFNSIKYTLDEDCNMTIEKQVSNVYGPKEDDSGIIDDYYVNGVKVSEDEGKAAFAEASDDFGRLLMLSGNDSLNLAVFGKCKNELQYGLTYDDALSCLKNEKSPEGEFPPAAPQAADSSYTVVTKDGVIVREGPGREYDALKRDELNDEYRDMAIQGKGDRACLKQGSEVTCLATDGDWIQISAGWICTKYKDEVLVKKTSEL